MPATSRIEHESMGAAELSGQLKVLSVILMKIPNDLTDLSVDELRRLLDPEALSEGGIQGAVPAA
jgi:hypothetical protein